MALQATRSLLKHTQNGCLQGRGFPARHRFAENLDHEGAMEVG